MGFCNLYQREKPWKCVMFKGILLFILYIFYFTFVSSCFLSSAVLSRIWVPLPRAHQLSLLKQLCGLREHCKRCSPESASPQSWEITVNRQKKKKSQLWIRKDVACRVVMYCTIYAEGIKQWQSRAKICKLLLTWRTPNLKAARSSSYYTFSSL